MGSLLVQLSSGLHNRWRDKQIEISTNRHGTTQPNRPNGGILEAFIIVVAMIMIVLATGGGRNAVK